MVSEVGGTSVLTCASKRFPEPSSKLLRKSQSSVGTGELPPQLEGLWAICGLSPSASIKGTICRRSSFDYLTNPSGSVPSLKRSIFAAISSSPSRSPISRCATPLMACLSHAGGSSILRGSYIPHIYAKVRKGNMNMKYSKSCATYRRLDPEVRMSSPPLHGQTDTAKLIRPCY
jgi:hypothetical protein